LPSPPAVNTTGIGPLPLRAIADTRCSSASADVSASMGAKSM
jgi:hypothetical protein